MKGCVVVLPLLAVLLGFGCMVQGSPASERTADLELVQLLIRLSEVRKAGVVIEDQRKKDVQQGQKTKKSWDSYIENLIGQSKDATGTAHVDRACIIGFDGAPWTTSGHANALKLEGSEGVIIGKAFKSKDFTPFMTSGIYAEGVKYHFLSVEDSMIVYAKKEGNGCLTLQVTKTAVVIGHGKDGSHPFVNKAVGVIAEYMTSMNM